MKLFKLIIVATVLILTLSACSTEEVAADSYYVSIDINPSIEFIVDENDIVISFQLMNEEAEIIALNIDFVGMNVDDAVELFIQLATETGYIDVSEDDNAVLITVIGNDQQIDTETIRERIRARIGHYFIKNYIAGEILTEDFTEEDLIAQADELGVTPGKLALATLVLQTETETLYTLEDLLNLPIKDLVEIIRLYHEEAIQEYRETRMTELQELREQRMNQHKARFDQWVENHPNLTEDEIDRLWNMYKERIHRINRVRWQERIEQWKLNQEEHPEVQENNETTDVE